MKNLKKNLAIALVFNLALLTAQQEAYVAAESGLSLRDQPDITGKMLSKLAYGEAIGVLEETDKSLVVLDGGEKISGRWVKVETKNHIGYVFNGYLSKNKYEKGIELHHTGIEIRLKNLKSNDESIIYPLFEKDSISVGVELGDSPEGKTLVINNKIYKRVSIFQRYENSFSFMSADANCSTNEWKQFDTEWKPIKQLKSNRFETLTYSEDDWKDFIEKATKDLKDDVIDKCGDDWFTYVKTIKNIKDFPVSVTTNRVFIKFILTDSEDKITEKIIEFKIPEGS